MTNEAIVTHMLPKIIGIFFGILEIGIFGWNFKEKPLCQP